MEKISKVGKWLGKIADNASKKSSDLVETARLNSEISRMEADIEDIQFELGKLYYEDHKDEENVPYADLIEQIKTYEADIHARNEKLLAQKGLQYCEKCDAIVDQSDEFCSKCGTRVQVVHPQTEEDTRCKNCGRETEENQPFCPACGYTLKRQ